jgi:hypothetical protein
MRRVVIVSGLLLLAGCQSGAGADTASLSMSKPLLASGEASQLIVTVRNTHGTATVHPSIVQGGGTLSKMLVPMNGLATDSSTTYTAPVVTANTTVTIGGTYDYQTNGGTVYGKVNPVSIVVHPNAP